jgi:hypothetical protein
MTASPESFQVLVARGGARLVFLDSITVAIPIFVDPCETAFRRVQMLFQQLVVTGRAPGGVQGYQIKRCCIRRAVIGCVRDQLEMRKLAITQLVKDLSRLGIAVWIASSLACRLPKISSAARANCG